MDKANQYLHDCKLGAYENAPRITCADGFSMSVQASRLHYCSPRENGAFPYSAFEIGYPSEADLMIAQYAEDAESPTDTVYGYVPVETVNAVIEKHGGIKAA